MAARRLSMRKIKEVLRLRYEKGLSSRQIAKSLDIILVPGNGNSVLTWTHP
jgi:DNA-directed RNA polymerase specialized sigma subunit